MAVVGVEGRIGEGEEFKDGGNEVRGVKPRAPIAGRAGDLGGRAGEGAYAELGRGRGGNVGDGRPYELVGDIGTELGGPLIYPP